MAKKEWELAMGQRGSGSPDQVTDILRQGRADNEIKRMKRQSDIEELKDEVEKKKLEAAAKGEDKEKMAQLENENAELQKELERKEIDIVKTELGGKIDQLKLSLDSGASKKSIVEQIAEIKQAAIDMGLGGSKFSEIQEALALVEKLRPDNRGLVDSVKDAKELLQTFEKEKTGEFPAELRIQLQDSDHKFQLELERLKDDREQRSEEMKLALLKYGDGKALEQQRLQQEIVANTERTQLMKGGLDTLGRIAGKAMVEGGGGVAQKTNAARQYPLEADEGETGEFDCPGCGSKLYLAPDAARVPCGKCGSVSSFTRTKPAEEEAEKPSEKLTHPV